MSDQTPTELQCGAYDRGVPWKLFRKWWPSSRNSSHDVGLPPSLEAGDAWWLSLAAATWPGFVPAPLFVPYMSRLSQQPGQKISKETCKWTVSLDVAHFSPTEIFLSVKDGFLVVEGKHEERQDEHGFIARSFTRKYRLAGEIVTAEITATLSADGILTVEAPVPEESVPTVTVIPIKVEMEGTDKTTCEQIHKEETLPELDPDITSAPQVPECTEDDVVESTAVETDQDQPGNITAAPEQPEEKTGPEEKEEKEEKEGEGEDKAQIDPKPFEDPLPSEPADDSDKESHQESSEQHKDLESQGSPNTDPPEQAEHGESSQSEEIKVEGVSGEAAKEIPPEEQELVKSPESEVSSQEQEASDIKDEHTE